MQITISTRADEINRRWSEVQRSAQDTVLKAVELGRELHEAREDVGRGFGPWLEDNVQIGRRWAYRMISLYERRTEIEGADSIKGALRMVGANRNDEWLSGGYEAGELPLNDVEDAPAHIEVLSNEIHPMFLLDPVKKAKWSQIKGATIYRTILNGKPVRVAGTKELLELGNQQRITRLPQDVLSLDQGNQQRREGSRSEDAWVARQWADAALNRLSEDKEQRALQLVQFLAHGLPNVQREWIETRLRLKLDNPGERIADAIWGMLLVRDGDDFGKVLKH